MCIAKSPSRKDIAGQATCRHALGPVHAKAQDLVRAEMREAAPADRMPLGYKGFSGGYSLFLRISREGQLRSTSMRVSGGEQSGTKFMDEQIKCRARFQQAQTQSEPETQAVILAAGRGRRLGAHVEEFPKKARRKMG